MEVDSERGKQNSECSRERSEAATAHMKSLLRVQDHEWRIVSSHGISWCCVVKERYGKYDIIFLVSYSELLLLIRLALLLNRRIVHLFTFNRGEVGHGVASLCARLTV